MKIKLTEDEQISYNLFCQYSEQAARQGIELAKWYLKSVQNKLAELKEEDYSDYLFAMQDACFWMTERAWNIDQQRRIKEKEAELKACYRDLIIRKAALKAN